MSKITIYSPPATAQIKACAVDFDLRRAPVPVHLVQYDKTIPILAVSLYKGSSPYTLPADAEVNVRMNKRNNLCVYNPALGCNESRDVVYVAVTPQMTTQDGTFEPILEVVINSGVAGTSPMQLVIRRNPVQEDAIEDTSEAKTLTELVSQAAASATAAAQSAGAAAEDAGKAAASATAAAESDEHAAATAQNIKDSLDQIASNAAAVSQLKDDTAKLKDGKISKFYASSQGNTNLPDSDDGRIMDLMLYGKSSQDGTPTPDAPVEIKSVVNPVVKVFGANLLDVSRPAATNGKASLVVAGNVITVTAPKGVADYQWIQFEIDIASIRSKNIVLSYKKESTNPAAKSTIYIKVWYANGKQDFVQSCQITDDVIRVVVRILANSTTTALDTDNVLTVTGLMLKIGDAAIPWEPYTEQTATLPYTLNAIPVTSGGNVTIDGQQYIADYVDVERGKLVRMTERASSTVTSPKGTYFYPYGFTGTPKVNTIVVCDKFKDSGYATYDAEMSCCINNTITFRSDSWNPDKDKTGNDVGEVNFIYQLATPTETDLTADEIATFKALVSYYPVTNVSTTSDQLDGYTVFDYPISLANGWDYVKKQLGDTRDYLYGIDLMTAEAYVNSEYAAALAEIEV